MFTGIIQEIGAIGAMETKGSARRIECVAPILARDAILGESIAVNGVCLTLTTLAPGAFAMDAVEETLARTTLASLKRGVKVNLERAVRVGEPLGGHLVQGHVDCMGDVVSWEERHGEWRLRVRYPSEYEALVVQKGSVTIDGVSLTVAEHTAEAIMGVAVIPFTREHTIIQSYRTGTLVNLEFDIIGKYVLNAMRAMRREGPISEGRLRELGY